MIIVKCLLFLIQAHGHHETKQVHGELMFHEGDRWVVDFTHYLEKRPNYIGPYVLTKKSNDCLLVHGKLSRNNN